MELGILNNDEDFILEIYFGSASGFVNFDEGKGILSIKPIRGNEIFNNGMYTLKIKVY